MKPLALMLALLLASCGSPQRRPTITAAVAGAAMGFGGCEIDGVKDSTCAILGGSAALFLGGIAALVTLFVDTDSHQLDPDDEIPPPVHSFTALPPGLIDAGVANAPAAPIDVPIVIDAPPAPMNPIDAAL
ncbi:MAG TPA: hypothetical protein VGF94_14475 [Kofleriaceae bacterium]|jgi:hypothetical protein